MKNYPSIVSNDLIAIFPTPFPLNYSLPNLVSNCVGLEAVLAYAGLFCPEIIEIDGAIYRCENNDGKMTPYEGYGKDKKTLEKVNNVFSFNDFFLSTTEDAACSSEVLMTEFSEVLKYFWGIRLKSLYPNKTFEFIITDDGLYGEEGFCMTFYEVE
ncbi:TPA: hypothetical protein SLE41_003620 [Proteus mirabilis]|uniref:Uncharacterized protein n=1 Tax=Proteus mirabilis (strain HI4320) TaxID=529507 RepID=B4EVS8_PROMH|nr:hypothetical protein [Proteus mirabilis]EKT8672922.1 hypothetical protein [Proteus mirabilis]MBG3078576.1 hypothetical protein [Proteus mirabilis]MBG3128067.1 hypothetical protein [Proteus mirabilis]MBI6386175.1 hypothetical protein [Proteus mirabilis]CAR42441.1 hypothetical protein PMI1136 [Proteus mirabilis HI4320]